MYMTMCKLFCTAGVHVCVVVVVEENVNLCVYVCVFIYHNYVVILCSCVELDPTHSPARTYK